VTELFFKALLAQRVGLAAAGIFEIAQRVPMLLRAPLVAAGQVLLPAVAGRPDGLQALAGIYRRSSRLVGFATLAMFGSLLVAWPLLDVLLVGRYDRELYVIAVMVTVGWGLNLLAVPAYFSLLGMGSTAWNVGSHAVIALGVLLLAAVPPAAARLDVLVAGYTLSLVLGSYVVLVGLHRRVRVALGDCLAPGTALALGVLVILSVATAMLVPQGGMPMRWFVTVLAVGLFATSLLPAWRRLRMDLPAGLQAWP
jgi:O-antigen/teichoic acid export membrane protein